MRPLPLLALLALPSCAVPDSEKLTGEALALEEGAEDFVSLAHQRSDSDKHVVLLLSNSGFAPMLLNAVASMHKVGLHNYVVLATDPAACDMLSAGVDPNSCVTVGDQAAIGSAGASSYGTQQYREIVQTKPVWVRRALDAGLSVVFADADVVWLRNPLPWLKNLDVDIIWQNDALHFAGAAKGETKLRFLPNSGYYYARATTGTSAFFANWLDSIQSNRKLGAGDQAHVLPALLKTRAETPRFKFRQLAQSEFPNGGVYFAQKITTTAAGSRPFIVHANYNEGLECKIALLREAGLWFVDAETSKDATAAQQRALKSYRSSDNYLLKEKLSPGRVQQHLKEQAENDKASQGDTSIVESAESNPPNVRAGKPTSTPS